MPPYSRSSCLAIERLPHYWASPASNSWTEALIDIGDPAKLANAGDLDLSSEFDARNIIERRIREMVTNGQRPISLGGDHSVTYPILRGLARHYKNLMLLQIDAHPG